MIKILALAASLALVTASNPAQAYSGEGYIGEGIQGRPHGDARAAVRYDLYRHGFGYHRHPRRYWKRYH